MTFAEFYATEERMTVANGADHLRVDVEYFEGDDEIIVFDDYCFMTRRGKEYHTIIIRDEYTSADPVEVARHVYFDHWVWECADHDESFLIQFYNEWLEWQKLPAACALEILMGAELTTDQGQWLRDFIDLWDRVTA